MKSLRKRTNDILVWLDKALLYSTSYIRMGTHYVLDIQMKPCDRTKEQIRYRRVRNMVHKQSKQKGGYHSSDKYVRREKHKWKSLYSSLSLD